MRILALIAAIALASCASVSAEHTADNALFAIQNTRVRECPAERTQDNARAPLDGATSGVVIEDIGLTPVASDPTRAVRLRRIVVQPGGALAWHDHLAVQGIAILVSGEMTEYRNTCLDPLLYRAGDVAREDVGTAHAWRNLSDQTAVIIVAHLAPRP